MPEYQRKLFMFRSNYNSTINYKLLSTFSIEDKKLPSEKISTTKNIFTNLTDPLLHQLIACALYVTKVRILKPSNHLGLEPKNLKSC